MNLQHLQFKKMMVQSIYSEFDGDKISQLKKSILQLNSIQDKIVEVEKTITFTVSITDDSFIETYDGTRSSL